MLVLSRKLDQDVIGVMEIEGQPELRFFVRLVDIRSDKVRLGFEGPKKLKFWRREVLDQIESEKREASQRSDSRLTESGENR